MEFKSTFENLIVWQKALLLSKKIYFITSQFPKEELFGITNQLRRSSVSIPSNIAEGYGRNSRPDYKRFLSIALGSVYELQTQIMISKELKLVDVKLFEEIISLSKEIDRIIYAIIKKL